MTAFQLEGIMAGLRHAIACGQTPGDLTIQWLNKIRQDFQHASDGDPITRIPEIKSGSGAADSLVIAEMFRRSVIAFLTPEEVDDQRRIGFHAGETSIRRE